MSDITKARKYLTSRNSDMATLTSFGLMLNTARARYNDVRLRIVGRKEDYPGALSEIETYALLDYAVLHYLKKTNNLPPKVGLVFTNTLSLKEIKDLATSWLTT